MVAAEPWPGSGAERSGDLGVITAGLCINVRDCAACATHQATPQRLPGSPLRQDSSTGKPHACRRADIEHCLISSFSFWTKAPTYPQPKVVLPARQGTAPSGLGHGPSLGQAGAEIPSLFSAIRASSGARWEHSGAETCQVFFPHR